MTVNKYIGQTPGAAGHTFTSNHHYGFSSVYPEYSHPFRVVRSGSFSQVPPSRLYTRLLNELAVTQESLDSLYDKLTRKMHTAYHGQRVGAGWLKYEFNESVWNLDDGKPQTRPISPSAFLKESYQSRIIPSLCGGSNNNSRLTTNRLLLPQHR